ncbi:MAG TPA: ROK family protein [Bryobacteraceae bacterium]
MIDIVLGAIEAGGSKFVCGIGSSPGDLITTQIPTTTPAETLEAVIEFFRREAGGELQAVGIASFGPLDPHPGSPTFGFITCTPKLGWRGTDVAGTVARGLGVPVGFDTDVNGAALAEARWGAARGLADFLYLTVGTGIGGGAMVNGKLLHGLLHPEMGHLRIPHDRARDPYAGGCPFHGDCLEGLASGPALRERWSMAPRELPPAHPAWALEAEYLALGLHNLVCTLSPRRIVIGGGVLLQPCLLPMVHTGLARLLNGYIEAVEIVERMESFVVLPQLGGRAGVLGALLLAEEAARRG